MENPIPIETLFRRFLENKCTPEEVAKLLAHFRTGEDEEQLRRLIAAELDAADAGAEKYGPAVREVYASLADRIATPVRKPVRPLIAPYIRNAAVWLLVLLSAGAVLYILNRREKAGGAVAMLHAEAAAGEKKEVVLPDSSHIWLNAGSSVDYPRVFQDKERNVNLTGEAFFEVARDTARPFVICTGALRTRVIGTSFNIKAYPEDSSIAVSVVTGRVNVSSVESGASVELSPDEQAVYGKFDRRLLARAYPDAGGLSVWKDGRLQFRNSPLHEVIRTLERRFDVAVKFDDRARDCPVHADFDDTEPVTQILGMLAASLSGKLEGNRQAGYTLVTGECL
ncbi:FecR domain-containing protein [Dyadobacter sp. 676]|uniref:FecR domain-containing protein n=1 Tax=Dyadobacter sp. 676 TaxID=3088362 RepID=A0AAU8FMA6_9BACT